MYYYRIFDDKEELNFFKSSFDYNKIAGLVKEFEVSRQEYFNKDFLSFLKERDKDAEMIEVTNIYY